jgi:hypothetical protein
MASSASTVCTGATSLITSSSISTNQNHEQKDPVYWPLHVGRRDVFKCDLPICVVVVS